MRCARFLRLLRVGIDFLAVDGNRLLAVGARLRLRDRGCLAAGAAAYVHRLRIVAAALVLRDVARAAPADIGRLGVAGLGIFLGRRNLAFGLALGLLGRLLAIDVANADRLGIARSRLILRYVGLGQLDELRLAIVSTGKGKSS